MKNPALDMYSLTGDMQIKLKTDIEMTCWEDTSRHPASLQKRKSWKLPLVMGEQKKTSISS